MPISENLRFTANVPKDTEYDHRPGFDLTRTLAAQLSAKGWSASDIDSWRDCGWYFVCRRSQSELEVVVLWVERGYWLAQIKPRSAPRFLGRLLGRKPSASVTDVYELALAVHRTLASLNYLGNPLWRWDGFPDEKHSSREPQRADS